MRSVTPSAPVPTVEALNMKNAYLFKDGADEFTPPSGTKVNKAFRSQVDRFLSSPTRVVSEFPLQMFSTWFQDLPLNDVVMSRNEAEECDKVWQYKVILLYPRIVGTTKAEVKKWNWAKAAAAEFYCSTFNASEDDVKCIDKAVAHDPSILVIGCEVVKGEEQHKKSISQYKDAVVISCITFRNGIGEEECGSSSVLWLLVAGETAKKPSYVVSWRRLGFGRLMLIMLIKRSTFELLFQRNLCECKESLPGVDIYLQCTQGSAMAFYRACGFVQVNLDGTTGFELLPKTIAASCSGESDGNFAWIVPESEEHCIIPLMRLRSGALLNSAAVGMPKKYNPGSQRPPGNDDSERGCAFVWCQYPPSAHKGSNPTSTLLLTRKDLERAYAGLDFLNNLLPLPMEVLLGPNKMHLTGEVKAWERLRHSKSHGTSWMTTGQIEMMAALLMKDGRYEAYASILSLTDMQKIFGCFEKLQAYTSEKTIATNLGMLQRRQTALNAMFAQYEEAMNDIVKNILFFNPGLLQKNILVFPCNLGNSHWGGTFIFNPWNIEATIDDTSSVKWCRTFFPAIVV